MNAPSSITEEQLLLKQLDKLNTFFDNKFQSLREEFEKRNNDPSLLAKRPTQDDIYFITVTNTMKDRLAEIEEKKKLLPIKHKLDITFDENKSSNTLTPLNDKLAALINKNTLASRVISNFIANKLNIDNSKMEALENEYNNAITQIKSPTSTKSQKSDVKNAELMKVNLEAQTLEKKDTELMNETIQSVESIGKLVIEMEKIRNDLAIVDVIIVDTPIKINKLRAQKLLTENSTPERQQALDAEIKVYEKRNTETQQIHKNLNNEYTKLKEEHDAIVTKDKANELEREKIQNKLSEVNLSIAKMSDNPAQEKQISQEKEKYQKKILKELKSKSGEEQYRLLSNTLINQHTDMSLFLAQSKRFNKDCLEPLDINKPLPSYITPDSFNHLLQNEMIEGIMIQRIKERPAAFAQMLSDYKGNHLENVERVLLEAYISLDNKDKEKFQNQFSQFITPSALERHEQKIDAKIEVIDKNTQNCFNPHVRDTYEKAQLSITIKEEELRVKTQAINEHKVTQLIQESRALTAQLKSADEATKASIENRKKEIEIEKASIIESYRALTKTQGQITQELDKLKKFIERANIEQTGLREQRREHENAKTALSNALSGDPIFEFNYKKNKSPSTESNTASSESKNSNANDAALSLRSSNSPTLPTSTKEEPRRDSNANKTNIDNKSDLTSSSSSIDNSSVHSTLSTSTSSRTSLSGNNRPLVDSSKISSAWQSSRQSTQITDRWLASQRSHTPSPSRNANGSQSAAIKSEPPSTEPLANAAIKPSPPKTPSPRKNSELNNADDVKLASAATEIFGAAGASPIDLNNSWRGRQSTNKWGTTELGLANNSPSNNQSSKNNATENNPIPSPKTGSPANTSPTADLSDANNSSPRPR